MLCFRLHYTKDSQAVINTAGATVRQLVALVFERVMHEDEQLEQQQLKDCNEDDNEYNAQQQKNGIESSTPPQDHRHQQSNRTQPLPQLHHHHHQYNGSNVSGNDTIAAVSSLGPCATDAYNMFQVYCSLKIIMTYCFSMGFSYLLYVIIHSEFYIFTGSRAIGEYRSSKLASGNERYDQDIWSGITGVCAF